MEEFAKSYQFRSTSEYVEEILRSETQRSPAVTSGNANYFNSSVITSTHIHRVALTPSGCGLNSAAGIQKGHTPLLTHRP